MSNCDSRLDQRPKVLLEVARRAVCGRHLCQRVVQRRESQKTRIYQQQEVYSHWNAAPETVTDTER